MAKRKILMVQFRTDVSIMLERQSIIRHSSLKENEIIFYNVFDQNSSYDELFEIVKKDKPAVILGGSGEFYLGQKNKTDEAEKKIQQMLISMRQIIKYIFEKDIPMLGICFGHQLIAKCLGYEIKNDPAQAESDSLEITLNSKGSRDLLFQGIPKKFNAILGHKDSIMEIPKQSMLLGSSLNCKIQILKYGDKIYSVQFHPEMDLKDLEERLKLYPSYLPDGKELFDRTKMVDAANKILPNFLKIAGVI